MYAWSNHRSRMYTKLYSRLTTVKQIEDRLQWLNKQYDAASAIQRKRSLAEDILDLEYKKQCLMNTLNMSFSTNTATLLSA